MSTFFDEKVINWLLLNENVGISTVSNQKVEEYLLSNAIFEWKSSTFSNFE